MRYKTPRRYMVEIRGQHSRGSSGGGFGGPDTYVAVQIVPDGVDPLKVLREDIAAKRGIAIKYFGTGYFRHAGPRSSLGKAVAAAVAFAADGNRRANITRAVRIESDRLHQKYGGAIDQVLR